MLYVINIKCSLWSILKLIGSVTRTRVLYCQILFNSCCAGDRQSYWLQRTLWRVCLCVGTDFTFISGWIFFLWSLFHLWLIPLYLLFVFFLIYCDLCFSVTTQQQSVFPVSRGPLSIAQYKITLEYCPVFMPLGSRLAGLIYCWDCSRVCVQQAKKKRRKKLLIMNWGCFPHLRTEGH